MYDFNFHVPTKIFFGKESMEHIAEEIKKYATTALLVYGGGSIKENGIYDKIKKQLDEAGIKTQEISGIKPNPRIDEVREGIKIAREEGMQTILAIGGGSAIDTAKLIACGVYEEKDPWEIVTGKVIPKNALPIGTVLTLSATGTEMNANSVITNEETGEKLGWANKLAIPKFSVLNPENSYSVPKKHTAAGTADIMSHTMENYFTLDDGANLQDYFAISILKTCVEFGPKALENPKDYNARANLMWAGTWAINGLLDCGKNTSWSVHAMEHELSAYNDLTHGEGLAILTPRWLQLAMEKNPKTADKIAIMGYEVFNVSKTGDIEKDAKESIKALHEFFVKDMGIPAVLREVGYDDKVDFDEMGEKAVRNYENSIIHGYVDLNAKDVAKIYKSSLDPLK